MFEAIEQFEIDFPEGKAKFPIFYRDASSSVHMFLGKTSEVRKITPFRVQQILPGLTIISCACFNYKDTDIGPYNEIGITSSVAVSFIEKIPSPFNIIMPLLTGRFNVHVIYLPVTTPIAYIAGVKVYNYPKFVADISFEGETFSLIKDRKTILEVKKKGKTLPLFRVPKRRFIFTTFQVKDRVSMKTDVYVEAEDVSVHLGGFSLHLGKFDEVGRSVSNLLISNQSVLSIYIERMRAILYLPQAI